MRVAIIAEGAEDQIVIQNILRAFKIDSSDILFVKPSLQKDASSPDDATIGTFQGVKKACMGIEDYRYYFEMAFLFFAADCVIVHLDTAEIEQQDFPFQKPTKQNNENYSKELRKLVIDLINSWLDNKYTETNYFMLLLLRK